MRWDEQAVTRLTGELMQGAADLRERADALEQASKNLELLHEARELDVTLEKFKEALEFLNGQKAMLQRLAERVPPAEAGGGPGAGGASPGA